MIKRISKHRYILKKIAQSSAKTRANLIKKAPPQFFTMLKDICKLVIDGKLKLGKAKKHKNFVKTLSKQKLPIKASFKQRGGVIGSIIAGVLPFLTPLLAKLIK